MEVDSPLSGSSPKSPLDLLKVPELNGRDEVNFYFISVFNFERNNYTHLSYRNVNRDGIGIGMGAPPHYLKSDRSPLLKKMKVGNFHLFFATIFFATNSNIFLYSYRI